MKKNNYFFKLLPAICISAVLFSCNNNSGSDTGAAKNDSSTMDKSAAAPMPAAPAQTGPSAPFDVMTIYHTVKDYGKWRPAFDADSTARHASGLTEIVVGRKADKPNDLEIVLMVSDTVKAKAFSADPRLKEVMEKNGVISKPEMDYWHVIRYNSENDKSSSSWAEITHKVKDFDAWVKVFDAEGPAKRAGYGMSDAVLARGIGNPHLVYLVFAVTDMAKAKARMADPALKKLMMDAGVEGKPKIEFFTDASK